MSKIRVLSDHVANQIAAGEVVERPASVAKELVENSIDAGARRVEVDVEAGGRRLLRVADDGEGMTRDDAVLAFERHATSKLSTADDLNRVRTLGFRGEALASIASVARVELVTQTGGADEATRVLVEGGKMRDVSPAARPRGTTVSVRDLFFNVPARRKFLRSEATESFHLTNLVTHYALAHPEISFLLTNNGRETLRAAPASDLRERAYQIFGAEFLDGLLEVDGGLTNVARVRGYVSAPRERRTTRDAQYLFVNGRFVRDRLVSRALSDGYRAVLPHGAYPAALLFLEVPLEEVDVNVHPAKTEVRFRRAAAVADAVREAVRAALGRSGYVRADFGTQEEDDAPRGWDTHPPEVSGGAQTPPQASTRERPAPSDFNLESRDEGSGVTTEGARQEAIKFSSPVAGGDPWERDALTRTGAESSTTETTAAPTSSPAPDALKRSDAGRESLGGGVTVTPPAPRADFASGEAPQVKGFERATSAATSTQSFEAGAPAASPLPPLKSAAGIVREVPVERLSVDVRPLGQIDDSFIVANDSEGMLLIDQHAAHERILFDKYHRLEASRQPEAQQLLVPETFDLTPAQAAAFDVAAEELESYGFSLMRLSGRTVAVRAVPADLPPAEARNMLAEVLDSIDAEKRGAARQRLRERIAASLACRAAIKINTPLTAEKMNWLVERLLQTSSPTTCPHGRPSILRLTRRDIERGFHRP